MYERQHHQGTEPSFSSSRPIPTPSFRHSSFCLSHQTYSHAPYNLPQRQTHQICTSPITFIPSLIATDLSTPARSDDSLTKKEKPDRSMWWPSPLPDNYDRHGSSQRKLLEEDLVDSTSHLIPTHTTGTAVVVVVVGAAAAPSLGPTPSCLERSDTGS